MEFEKIIEILKKEIDNISKNNQEISKLEVEKNQLKKLLIELQKIVNTPKSIVDLKLEELSKYTSKITEEVKEKINFYCFILKNANDLISITEEQVNYIKNLISNIINELNVKLDKVEKQIGQNKKTKAIDEINELITKINGLNVNDYFNAKDIEELRKILDKYIGTDLSLDEYIELIIKITNTSITNITKCDVSIIEENNDELIEELLEVNNNEEDIINLLKKYKYDFNLLKDKNKELILKFVNVSNMDNIL